MAELWEGTSAPVNSKEKKSLLDEDIGTDFLTSWKSMSVTEDDAMDFSFDTVPNGKKKFNFDKLDMDFNLDSDFDKFASFKVDIPDLDFSSPSKTKTKTKTKTKERTDEDSTGGEHQGKKSHHFNFSFDFNNEDFASDAQTGSKLMGDSKSFTGDLIEDEPILPTGEMNVNNLSNISGSFNSDDAQNGSKLVGNSRPQEKQVTEGEPAILGSEKNAGRKDVDSSHVQILSNLVGDSKPLTRELTDDEPGLLRSENNVKNFYDIREGIESDGVQSENKLAADARPEDKQVAIEESIIPESEKCIEEDFNTNDAQITNNLVSSKSLPRELTINETVSVGSEKDVRSLGNIREDFSTNDAQITNNLVSSKSLLRELTTNDTVSLGSEKDVKSLSNIREGIHADAVQNGSKIVVNSRLQDKEVTTGEPVMLRSEKISGNFQANPSSSSEKMSKSSAEASGNPKFLVSSKQSIRNVKTDSVEGLKTGKRTLDLSSLKILRATGTKKEVPNSKVLRQSDSSRNLEQNMKLLGNMRSNIAHPIGGTEKRKPLTPPLKRKKTEESNAELVSLKPLKRFSESPEESRNFKEPSGRIIEEEGCNHENQRQSKTKNMLHDLSASGLEVSQEINMNELEISLVMENDGNVEKAEAFTKELEDICNMLKKKHEEAKEILVRAIVNNNNLLMLNHPINEEKIHVVQKFATQLTLKEVQT